MRITPNNCSEINFSKSPDGLVPAIVQDAHSLAVLMQGYMNAEAVKKSLSTGKVTFYSRSKERLWTKGESSKNYLNLVSIHLDCDADSLLIRAIPKGPACHTGEISCWGDELGRGDFLHHLEKTIQLRRDNPSEGSYTRSLLNKGINKVAQKVGEEAVELVIEAKDNDKDLFLNEAADLMYHYLVLLAAKGYTLEEVKEVLRGRHG